MTTAELMAEHGSPLWLVDLDRVRARLREFRAAWERAWPDVEVAYSYKTNRLPAILRALAAEGAGARGRVRGRVRAGARRRRRRRARRHRQRPGQARRAARARRGRRRAGDRRLRARARARRRAPASSASACASALPGIGVEPTRFGIAPGAVVAEAAARARALGPRARGAERAPRLHRLRPAARGRAARSAPRSRVQWPPAPGRPRRARPSAWRGLARELGVAAVDLGGGFPAAPAVAAHAAAVAGALRAERLRRPPDPRARPRARHRRRRPRLSVVAVKAARRRHALRRRRRGHEPAARRAVGVAARSRRSARGERPTSPGARQRPAVPERRRAAPGGASCPSWRRATSLLVRAVGAYQQAQSTQFGDLRPAVVARDDGRWRVCQRRETLEDLLAGDLDVALAATRRRLRGGTAMTERLIVIGGGGAGISAATTAKRVNPDLKVSLFTEFEDIAYSPCGIPFVHGGEIPRFEDLFLSTVERYVSDGLDMRMETVDHRHRPRPRHRSPRATSTRASTSSIVCHRLRVGEARRAGREPRGPALRQEHPQGDGVRQGARHGQDASPSSAPRRSASRWRATSATAASRSHFIDEGPWVLHEVLDPDVAEPVHESLTERGVTLHLGTAGRGVPRRRPRARGRDLGRRDRLRRRDRLPAQGAEHGAGRGGRARRSARPAA